MRVGLAELCPRFIRRDRSQVLELADNGLDAVFLALELTNSPGRIT